MQQIGEPDHHGVGEHISRDGYSDNNDRRHDGRENEPAPTPDHQQRPEQS